MICALYTCGILRGTFPTNRDVSVHPLSNISKSSSVEKELRHFSEEFFAAWENRTPIIVTARARYRVVSTSSLATPRRIKWVAAVERERNGMRILGTESCINSRFHEERRKCLVIFAVR